MVLVIWQKIIKSAYRPFTSHRIYKEENMFRSYKVYWIGVYKLELNLVGFTVFSK